MIRWGNPLIQVILAVIILILSCTAERNPQRNENVLRPHPIEQEQIDQMIQTAWTYRLEDPLASQIKLRKAEEKSKSLGYAHGEGMALLRQSILDSENEPKLSKQKLMLAKKIFDESKDKKGQINVLISRGILRAETASSDIHESIRYYQQALELCQPEDLYTSELFDVYMRISVNFRTSGDNAASKSFIEKAALYIRTPAEKALYHSQLAITLKQTNDLDSAIEQNKFSLLLYQELNMPRRAAAIIFNIGLIEYERKNLQLALEKFVEASAASETSKDITFHLRIKLNQAKLYDELNQPDHAEHALLTCQKLLKQITNHRLEADVYQALSEHNKRRGRFETALNHLEQYTTAREKLLDQTRTAALAQAQEELGTQIKDQEIIILRKEKLLQLTIFSALLIIVCIALFFLVRKVSHLLTFWKKQKFIGQYRLLSCIGSGGMGVVHLAQSLKDKTRHVAIKILKEELLTNEENRRRFKREGEIMDRLQHPNIVKVFERGEDNGRHYLALEYLSGRTLEEFIKETPNWPLWRKLTIMIQVCSALRAVHDSGIVHRDLKPSNIMICNADDGTEQAKLLDFGLAHLWYHSKLTQTGVIMGTLCYQAPEQFETLSSGPKTDIYALGLIFYEILRGSLISTEESISNLSRKILMGQVQESFRFPVDTPSDLCELLREMADKNSQKRPAIQMVFEKITLIQKKLSINDMV
jgi:tRNA A-37 threonylcarbamoyl transferase component Bud32/tetratricopeptide (TPR) repeat protein